MDSGTESVTIRIGDSGNSVAIHFDGICTHFRGIVPGVPHRVVLPDAKDARTGEIQVGDGESVQYSIPSHRAKLMSSDAPVAISIDGLIADGVLQEGVRLQIANPLAGQSLTYPANGDYDQMPPLTGFLSGYRPSADVVLGGDAICYFDFFEGVVTTTTDGVGGPTHTCITVQTDGAPMLQVAPLHGDPTAGSVQAFKPVQIPSVVSIENFCEHGGEFDFLLNYLTAEGGIPPKVGAGFPREQTIGREGTSAACSDSRYP